MVFCHDKTAARTKPATVRNRARAEESAGSVLAPTTVQCVASDADVTLETQLLS